MKPKILYGRRYRFYRLINSQRGCAGVLRFNPPKEIPIGKEDYIISYTLIEDYIDKFQSGKIYDVWAHAVEDAIESGSLKLIEQPKYIKQWEKKLDG